MKKRLLPNLKKSWYKITFFAVGLASLVWFLIRVIPKPSRVTYPCVRTAAPFASSFVAYLIGLGSATFFLRRARVKLKNAKYLIASLFLVLGIALGFTTNVITSFKVKAQELQAQQAGNEPVGVGKGIFPGRVVWEYNPDATDENCTNSTNDYWYMDSNTDQDIVNDMVSNSIQNLTGATSDADAWDAIFKYYNKNHEKGDVGYTAGEKIVIKINMNGTGNGPENINTNAQLCYAVISQLVDVAGVAQSDISIGDPNCNMDEYTFNKMDGDYPDVTYWRSGFGTNAEPTAGKILKSSSGETEDQLPQAYVDAAYMINIPVFKKHHRAGISLIAKNHFGSLAPYANGAWHQHYGLPSPIDDGDVTNGEYGVYRCLTDILGHEQLGGKTILYIVDALWGSTNWGHPPIKFRMSPFNNDWPSSLFVSFDPVATESVCYDFLYEEFDEDHPTEGTDNMQWDPSNVGPYPRFAGADDHLHQAADPSQWPAGIDYDPEQDGSVISSLGTHEHWNNAEDKQYSRNLGTGNGIELFSSVVVTSSDVVDYTAEGFELHTNYPNPFSGSTTLRYTLAIPSYVQVKIFNANGQLVKVMTENQRKSGLCELTWDGTTNGGERVAPGMYICSMLVENDRGSFEMSNSMLAVE